MKAYDLREDPASVYLRSLSPVELLEMYADAARHEHYCPFACRCFESWSMKVPLGRIQVELEERLERLEGRPEERSEPEHEDNTTLLTHNK